ncbi:MAG: pirin family protein [Verrucomicrobia bacterium]|nr:pirin family protein [Verrucomicrobiota bacterium]
MPANADESASISVRKSAERGRAELGWLHSRFSFSFADYHDPAHMGFRALRVINDDIIDGGQGFGTHPHRDMEIISYVVSGALEHKDNMGNGSVIRPGDVQRMSAGTGVRHSEFNPSPTAAMHLLQIWILPARNGLPPGYEQKQFSVETRRNRLCLIGSQDGRDGSVTIQQDVRLYASLLDAGARVQLPIARERHAWIQIVSGAVTINGTSLDSGDGAAVRGARGLDISGVAPAEFLLFDLA